MLPTFVCVLSQNRTTLKSKNGAMTVSLGEGRGIAPSKSEQGRKQLATVFWRAKKIHTVITVRKISERPKAVVPPRSLCSSKMERAKKAGIVARDDQLDHFRNLHESKRFAASSLITTRLPNITMVYLFQAVAIA